MTLIAGFHSFGAPVLIGDFLTTSTSDTTGLRKKILKITDNFVLAWTGHLIAANSVVRRLLQSLDLNTVTLESVKAILTDPTVPSDSSGLDIRLVCWVIDANGEHCFLWNSLYPQELFMGAPKYDGSGELWALALAGIEGRLHHSSPRSDGESPHWARQGVLGITTRLMEAEIWGPPTKPLGFGFAYEVLILTSGNRFEYLDNALYIRVTFVLDTHGHFLSREFGTSFYKYKSHGDYSVVYLYDSNARKQEVHAIESLGLSSEKVTKALGQIVLNPDYSYPFESDYYCISIRLKAPCFTKPPSMSVILSRENARTGGIQVDVSEKNVIQIPFSHEWVEWVYGIIKADMMKTGQI